MVVVGVFIDLVLVVSAAFYKGFSGVSVDGCVRGVRGIGLVEMRVVVWCCGWLLCLLRLSGLSGLLWLFVVVVFILLGLVLLVLLVLLVVILVG